MRIPDNFADNPFAPPQEIVDRPRKIQEPEWDELAGRFTRFAAAFVDGLLQMAILLPIQFATGFLQNAQQGQSGTIEQILMTLVGVIIYLLVNGYLLITRGQTIGKWLAGIQVVEYHTGYLLPFSKIYLVRQLWTFPMIIAVILIPGTIDNFLLPIVVYGDILMIFGTERRCLHDLLAGSKVVLFQADRPRWCD